MSKTDKNQQLLNWLNNEKRKDEVQLNKSKQDLIKELKGFKKEYLFPKPEKITLWKKLKILILGK
jgi:hypothetical protein